MNLPTKAPWDKGTRGMLRAQMQKHPVVLRAYNNGARAALRLRPNEDQRAGWAGLIAAMKAWKYISAQQRRN